MKKIFVSILAALCLSAGANAAFGKVNSYNNDFSDVSQNNWFYENVKTAYELGFMKGKDGGVFDPNGNVTVAEGVTMVSRLHAAYNDSEVTVSTEKKEYRIDFDSLTGMRLNHATGEIVDGVLVMQPDAPRPSGLYDAGVYIEGLNLEARKYNKMTIRIKRDILPNTDPDAERVEKLEVYFKTDIDPAISEKKCLKPIVDTDAFSEWLDVEIELMEHEAWQNNIIGIRLDPTNNNGKYYIDYISLTESDNAEYKKWYDMYVDYAVEKGIISKDTYSSNDYSRNITRAELCDMFAAALPEEYYSPINNIKGIPDVLRDEKNADVYLMLYNAGILLGSDKEGTFNAKSDIKRSEVAAIINRAALPENRVKGEIAADWTKQGNEYDLEFNDDSYLTSLTYEAESVEIKNGALVLTAKDRGADRTPQYDPKIIVNDINIPADEYSTLKVRMKIDFIGEITNTKFDFYYMTESDTGFSEKNSAHQDFREFSYVDPAGWYVLEVDLSTKPSWSGNITSFRFDPANTNGVYTIDYIRLAKRDPLQGASHEKLLAEGYTATRLMQDEGFERGFLVAQFEQKNTNNHGKWQDYCETDEAPLWRIAPWWCKYDLWENRDPENDAYTLSDTYGVNTLKYNPEEKSISLRMNATNIYEGQPHIKDDKSTPDVDESNYTWWPHLLVEQDKSFCSFDKERNSAAADRMFVELDMRITDFKPTTNTEGTNVCDFLAYFYMQSDKTANQRIWFGFELFSGANLDMSIRKTGWAKDSAAQQYMYGIRQNTIYNGMENSFNPEVGKALVSDEWKHIRIDITPHIKTAIEWANRDNIFGVPVTVEDMYFSGVNIGYEIHGNFDCTVEFKNFNMVAYNKD